MLSKTAMHQLLVTMKDKGADLKKRGFQGITPIAEAARLGNWKVAQRRIDPGADPRGKTDTDQTLFTFLYAFL